MAERTIGANVYIQRILSFSIAIIIAFGLTSVLIYLSGYSILEVFWLSLSGGFGSLRRIGLSLNEAAPLLFCSLAYIVAFKSGVWNIGAEGQLFLGAAGTAIAGLFMSGLPPAIHIPVIIISSFLFGAAWGMIPGFLKARFDTNEILTSLLMNFIAIWLVSYLVRFPMRNPDSYIAVTRKIAHSSRLPQLLPETTSHIGILIALGLSALIWFVFEKTVLGYRLKAIGVNKLTALYGGIPVEKLIVIAMVLSGGIAGLAGMSQVLGVHFLLAEYISPAHYGFFAIPLVFITRLNPYGAIVASVFFGGLLTGSRFVQMSVGIDPTVITIFVSLIMIALMLDPFIERKLSDMFFKMSLRKERE
jgi:simple sugar transport system permease protein